MNKLVVIFATTGVILSAAYALYLYRRVVFGSLDKENLKVLIDLSSRENSFFIRWLFLQYFFGIYPTPILKATAFSVKALINKLH